jgi:hypothetical protein
MLAFVLEEDPDLLALTPAQNVGTRCNCGRLLAKDFVEIIYTPNRHEVRAQFEGPSHRRVRFSRRLSH